MTDLLRLDAHDLLAGFVARRFSPSEVLDQVGQRIEATRDLNAFVSLDLEGAFAEARQITTAYARGEETRPLAGIPLAVKDIIDTSGLPTTRGSSIFRDLRPTADATVVARARQNGAIVVGKTNTHEFAWGITTDNPHFGASRNPWDRDRSPGGSSGGSAVAVATGTVPIAIGTDTGGSVRIPAAFCGVFGLKPSFGLISTSGVFRLARTLDHVGILSRTPRDSKLFLSVVADRGTVDGTTALVAGQPAAARELRIGRCFDAAKMSEDLAAASTRALAVLDGWGATLVDVAPLPAPEPTFAAIQGAEAYHFHHTLGLFPTRAADYGTDVRERLERAADITISDYLIACEQRDEVRGAWADSLQEVDVIASPVSPGPPPAHGTSDVLHQGVVHDFRDLVMPFTIAQNLTGMPACSIPVGLDCNGLPMALQLTGRHGDEKTITELADALVTAIGAPVLDGTLKASL